MKRLFLRIVPALSVMRKSFLETAKYVIILLVLAVVTARCNRTIHEDGEKPHVSDVNFTPCQQTKAKSAELSGGIDVKFTNEGVQITYCNLEVTCDFIVVDVTHTFVNGVLTITQKGFPNKADCVCYSDVSYIISGISQNEVNVIFINGEQVYCYNDSGSTENPEVPDNVKGVYVVGYKHVYGQTKSGSNSRNFTSGIRSEQLHTALMSGNSLHLFASESSQNENNRIRNNTGSGIVALLWKDGKTQTLSDNLWSVAYSVFVADNDVYVAGFEGSMGGATVWKNGKAQNLTSGTEANSVYVSNGDVYVAGCEWNYDTQNHMATLWINGKAQYLSSGTTWMSASSVYVSGSDVYVVGLEIPDRNKGIAIAKLWINGQEKNLTDGINNAWAKSVFVSGNDVYVAGIEGVSARLWKNGVVQNLENGTDFDNYSLPNHAYSVFISGNDVYVSGSKIWKNGKVLYERGGNYSFESIFVSGNDLYVAGSETDFRGTYSVAKLWKNGVIQDISYGSTMSFANSVFVVN